MYWRGGTPVELPPLYNSKPETSSLAHSAYGEIKAGRASLFIKSFSRKVCRDAGIPISFCEL